MITIYTDGSSKGNPGPGGWGAILISEKAVEEIGGREAHTTNNRMELTACIRALESIAPNGDVIVIFTDSQYVQKGMTGWIYTWQENNWRTAARKSVENQDLWQVLIKTSEGKKIDWKFIYGHSDSKENERCDEIATSFADGLTPTLYNGPKAEYRNHQGE